MTELTMPLTRAAFIDRLRAWAGRAESEVSYTSGTMRISWQGQASVLRAVMGMVSGGAGASADAMALRQQLIGERQKAITAWEAARAENMVAFHAGEVQGYNLILDLLKDAGDAWVA